MGKNKKELQKNSETQKTEIYAWTNRKLYCSQPLHELKDSFITPHQYSFTEVKNVVVGQELVTPEIGTAHYQDIIIPMEVYKHPAECLTQIANSNLFIAQAEICSARLISQSILNSCQMLCNSLDTLANEFERKNKMDEYYMLIREIEQYEDTLLELGYFKEAYEKLNLVIIPTISVNKNEARTLLRYSDSIFSKTMKSAQMYLEHPLVFLPQILYTMAFDSWRSSRYSVPDKKPEFHSYDLAVKENYNYYMQNDNNDFIETNDRYIELLGIVDTINREILLINLRGLHSELRRIVREYKIQSYNNN